MTETKNTSAGVIARSALNNSRARSALPRGEAGARYKEQMEQALAGLLEVTPDQVDVAHALHTFSMSERFKRIEKKLDNYRRFVGFDKGYLYGISCAANWVQCYAEQGASAEMLARHIRDHGIENNVDGIPPAEDEPGQWAMGLARPVVAGMGEERVRGLLKVLGREKAFAALRKAAEDEKAGVPT